MQNGIAQGGREDDVTARGRLLERLQKGVRRLRLESIGIVDHGDFVGSEERLHLDRVLKVAHLADEDSAGFRFWRDLVQIRVGQNLVRAGA